MHSKKYIFLTFNHLILNRLFRKITTILSNKYIVHLDYYLNYKEETMLRGEMHQASLKQHHDSVHRFLLAAQKKLDKEVIICIHPLYPIEYFRNFYKDFKIVKYKYEVLNC